MSAKIPTLLALDTATPVSSAAVTGEGLSVQKIDESGAGHSESLIGEVDAVLREAGVSLSDCDAVVFGAGPGAFTGLRVACGVAQGLAWAKEKPIVAASNLEALAMKELSGKPAGTRILAAFDARMHQAYCAVYEKAEEGARLSELVPAELVTPDEHAGLAESFGVALASGSGVRAFPESFAVLGDRVTLNPDATVTALDLAALGAILFKLGLAVIPELAAPLYVRNHVALTIEERAAGKRL